MEKETAIVCCLPSILFVGIGGFYLNEKEITSPCGDKVKKIFKKQSVISLFYSK